MISYENISGYNSDKKGGRCMICNYCYFKDNFDYQPYVCNECRDFFTTVMDLIDFLILSIKGNDYRVCISGIDKKEAIIILKSSNLNDKGVL